MATSKEKAKAAEEQKALVALSPALQQQMAMAVELSHSGIVPVAYAGRPAAIFAAVQYGSEFGLKPMTSLQNIAVVNGKPTLGTDVSLALAMRHPEWAGYEINILTEEKCKITVYRQYKKTGKTVAFTGEFSMVEARAAGLCRPDSPWVKWKKRMLKHRATSFALRDAFPDALAGVYSPEEMSPDSGAVEDMKIAEALDDIEGRKLEERGIPVEIVPEDEPPPRPATPRATAKPTRNKVAPAGKVGNSRPAKAK